MKLHHKGPRDAGIPVGEELPIEKLTDEALVEKHTWYNGLRQWNQPGRFFERVTVATTESMRTFIDDVNRVMAGSDYATHIVNWDGRLPLMNLCVFDRNQVVITFSTAPGEDPYVPIMGFRIKHRGLTEFFYHEYYKKMVAYSRSGEGIQQTV